jgi:hypothetical protein
MTQMDHNEAVRLHAVEKYLLGELPKEQHAAYEEHYFDCPACAEELKATVAFMESARQVVRQKSTRMPDAARFVTPRPSTHGWFRWLFQPAFSIPVFAALVLFIAYQNSVTIPNLKQGASQSASAKIVNSFSFMEIGARGDAALDIKVRPDEEFALEVDFPPVASAVSYVGQIQDAAGHTEFTLPVSLEQANSTVHISVPAGSLKPGRYNFVIQAVDSSAGQAGTLRETKRLPFTVEFLQ